MEVNKTFCSKGFVGISNKRWIFETYSSFYTMLFLNILWCYLMNALTIDKIREIKTVFLNTIFYFIQIEMRKEYFSDNDIKV